MRIETKFNQFLEQEERQTGRNITLKELSENTSLAEDVLALMKTSHYNDISTLSLGSIITITDYFNTTLFDFLIIKDEINTSNEPIDEDNEDENTQGLYSPSRCSTSGEFIRAIRNSKNFKIYDSVPTLIKSIGDLIDNNSAILVGTSSNFNVKMVDENVLIRFFAKSDKIYIKDILFGKSIAKDKLKLYKNIYNDYFYTVQKDSVDTAQDVELLISLVNNTIKNLPVK
ncbi:MAG: hypothetical protein K0R54_5461 [Clostridiaceae bacterium]|jgi:hypothetical protein|nr:hypothetical protein [Clostridiaceae bacterium]